MNAGGDLLAPHEGFLFSRGSCHNRLAQVKVSLRDPGERATEPSWRGISAESKSVVVRGCTVIAGTQNPKFSYLQLAIKIKLHCFPVEFLAKLTPLGA